MTTCPAALVRSGRWTLWTTIALLLGHVLLGCSAVAPVYLDTDLDEGQREAIESAPSDSVAVAFGSRVQATRFSPFGPGYAQDQAGLLGVRVPIQAVMGALVDAYARHKFGVGAVRVDSATGSTPSATGARVRVTLLDFRLKAHRVSATEERPVRPVADSLGAGETQDTTTARGVVRGARMWVEVAVRRGEAAQATGLRASVERRFDQRSSARWRPVINALNDTMLIRVDRCLEDAGL